MADRPPPPDECANCGAAIPRQARACPECGADERTGWRECSTYDGLDLPEEAFDDDGRPTRASGRINGLGWYWWIVGAVMIAALVLGALGLR